MRSASKQLFGGALALVLTSCSPLKIFNAIVPKDSGSSLLARDVSFGGDPRQRLDIYGPRNRAVPKLPIILFFYGGSWNSGTKDGYAFVGRALASRGFIVAIPDYRVLPQYQYPDFLEDNAAAFRWVRAHAREFGGDSHRMILAGHSAGAYNAAMLALDPRWLGSDREAIRGLIGLAGPYDFLPLQGAVAQQTFGQVKDVASTQPITFVRAGDAPAFLATGDKDQVVRVSNSDSLTEKLRAVGVRVDRRRYSAVGHAGLVTAIAKPLRGQASVLEDLTSFAQRVTQ